MIDDEDDPFEEDEEDPSEEEELAEEGFFVEDEDGPEFSKKDLDNEGEESYFLEPADERSGGLDGLLDEYPEDEEGEEEDGEDAEEDA